MTKRPKPKRARKPDQERSESGARIRKFAAHSAVRGMYAMTEAALGNRSPLGALLDVLTREAFATIAEEHYDWVKAERGRKVVEPDRDGKDVGARPVLLDRARRHEASCVHGDCWCRPGSDGT